MKPHSTFLPNIPNPSILTFEKVVLRDIVKVESERRRVYHNLSKKERDSLRNLKSRSDLIVKQADKGGGLVLLNKVDYESEIFKQLGDTTAYSKLSTVATTRFSNVLRTIFHEGLAMEYITKDLKNFMLNEFPRTPVFYALPKIHKPGFPPSGRLIVAVQQSLHEPVSRYIDSILQPFVRQTRSFLLDTTVFITKIEGVSIPPASLILSFDVVSLYTNIPHEELRLTLQETFEKREHLHPPHALFT